MISQIQEIQENLFIMTFFMSVSSKLCQKKNNNIKLIPERMCAQSIRIVVYPLPEKNPDIDKRQNYFFITMNPNLNIC